MAYSYERLPQGELPSYAGGTQLISTAGDHIGEKIRTESRALPTESVFQVWGGGVLYFSWKTASLTLYVFPKLRPQCGALASSYMGPRTRSYSIPDIKEP